MMKMKMEDLSSNLRKIRSTNTYVKFSMTSDKLTKKGKQELLKRILLDKQEEKNYLLYQVN